MTEQKLKEIKMAWASGEVVQYRMLGGHWTDWEYDNELYIGQHEWRIKPKTININGHNVPKPLRELKRGQKYHVVDMTHMDLVPQLFWKDHDMELLWLERGLCHATKEAAIAHARALLSFTEQEQ